MSGKVEISFEEMSGKIVTFTVKVEKNPNCVLHEFEVNYVAPGLSLPVNLAGYTKVR